MKKIILTALAAASLCILSACSSDEPEPTMAEKCANGLSEDCLVGNWNLQAVKTLDLSAVHIDFGTTPSTLEFTKDGKFTFTCTSNTGVSEMAGRGCAGEKSFGTWKIEGKNLLLNISMSRCSEPAEGVYPTTPEITDTYLDLKRLVFHANDMTDSLTIKNATEYFVRAAN